MFYGFSGPGDPCGEENTAFVSKVSLETNFETTTQWNARIRNEFTVVLRRGRESGTPPKVTDVNPKVTDIHRSGALGLVGRSSHT